MRSSPRVAKKPRQLPAFVRYTDEEMLQIFSDCWDCYLCHCDDKRALMNVSVSVRGSRRPLMDAVRVAWNCTAGVPAAIEKDLLDHLNRYAPVSKSYYSGEMVLKDELYWWKRVQRVSQASRALDKLILARMF